MDLTSKLISVTEQSALASFHFIGKQNPYSADQAATTAMRNRLNELPIDGKIVIGEGERDEAPMLFIGEKVGQGSLKLDLAVDPLEGTGLCSKGEPHSFSVLAASSQGTLLHAPDVYMNKLACGIKNLLQLQNSPTKNIQLLAEASHKPISQIKVAVLNRPRHKSLIQEVQSTGAKLVLFQDGDVMMSLLTTIKKSIDLLLGSGGAPEGVLSAVALKILGGDFQGQLLWKDEKQKQRAREMGITNLDKIFQIDELSQEEGIFCATGVTESSLTRGVYKKDKTYFTETLVIHSKLPHKYQVIKNQIKDSSL